MRVRRRGITCQQKAKLAFSTAAHSPIANEFGLLQLHPVQHSRYKAAEIRREHWVVMHVS